MQAREWKVAGVVIEVGEIVVRFDVARIVFQRLREILERADRFAAIQFDDSQIAVSFRDVITFIDRFEIKLRRFFVALFVPQQRFLERCQQTGNLATHGPE